MNAGAKEGWILFALAMAVRLYQLGGPGLCDDEIATAQRVSHPLAETVSLIRHAEFPPLHYAILNVWTGISGQGEWAMRFPSAFFSALTVVVIYFLGKELFSKGAGLLSAVLLIFSPFAVNYAQNAKMYALFWFCAALSFLFFFRFLNGRGKTPLGPYVAAATLACYTLYTGFMLLAAQTVIFLCMAERKRWGQWLAGQAAVIGLSLPWVIYFLTSSHENFIFSPPGEGLHYFAFLARALLWIMGGSGEWLGKLNYFLYFFLMAYLLADLVTAFQKKRPDVSLRNTAAVLLWLVLPVFIYLAFDAFWIQADLAIRYIGFLQVPLILLVSSQITRFKSPARPIAGFLIAAMAVGNTYIYFKDHLRDPPGDWRRTAQELSQAVGKKDLVLFLTDPSEIGHYYHADKNVFVPVYQKEQREGFAALFVRGEVSLSAFEKEFAGGGEIFRWLMDNGYFEEYSGAQAHPKQISRELESGLKQRYPAESGRILMLLRQALNRPLSLEGVPRIFIPYKNGVDPDVRLKGFLLAQKIDHGGIGFFVFRRTEMP